MERRGAIIGIAIAFLIVVILLFYPLTLGDLTAPISTHKLGHSILAYIPHFLIGATKRQPPHNFGDRKQPNQKRNAKNKISIFEGRGADKNRAIFQILVAAGPLSIGDIQRKLNKIRGLEVTYYASLNKRIHSLVKGGYIGEVKLANIRQDGFKAVQYEVLTKFYLAYYLNGKSREELLSKLNEGNAIIMLSDLINSELTEF